MSFIIISLLLASDFIQTIPINCQKKDLWAQQMVCAEAMKKRADEILSRIRGPKQSAVKLAIMDSGISKKAVKFIDTGEKITIKKFENNHYNYFPIITEIDFHPSDELNHGTPIAALITGQDNIGMIDKDFEFTLYKSDHSRTIFHSLEVICDENQDLSGVTVINLCISYPPEGLADEEAYSDEIKKLGLKGCLIVKSAGNHDFYDLSHAHRIDDAYLRVGSVDLKKHKTIGTDIGEIYAPGKLVWSISNENFNQSHDPSIGCDQYTGTSFATPLVSGIAAQVIRILKSGDYFSQLAPEKRVAQVSRILKYSEVGGVVNGRWAVEIAYDFNLVEDGYSRNPSKRKCLEFTRRMSCSRAEFLLPVTDYIQWAIENHLFEFTDDFVDSEICKRDFLLEYMNRTSVDLYVESSDL